MSFWNSPFAPTFNPFFLAQWNTSLLFPSSLATTLRASFWRSRTRPGEISSAASVLTFRRPRFIHAWAIIFCATCAGSSGSSRVRFADKILGRTHRWETFLPRRLLKTWSEIQSVPLSEQEDLKWIFPNLLWIKLHFYTTLAFQDYLKFIVIKLPSFVRLWLKFILIPSCLPRSFPNMPPPPIFKPKCWS